MSEEEEKKYLDDDWLEEKETDVIEEYPIKDRFVNILSINVVESQALKKKCSKINRLGIEQINIEKYNDLLLMKCVLDKNRNPFLTQQKLDTMKRNKNDGTYSTLLTLVLKHNGLGGEEAIQEEKN